LNNSMC